MDFLFILNSALLGVGLAMDAFSVSMANGLHEPNMRRSESFTIAGTFAFFQFLMPMIGWVCIHTIAERFAEFHKAIPWIALTLLLYIGGKMLLEGIRSWNEDPKASESSGAKLTSFELFIQGIATSIDALSVGFTIADYDVVMAFIASLIIAAVTLIICLGGLKIGRSFGTMLAGKASVLGGLILIGIGIEIFVKGMFF